MGRPKLNRSLLILTLPQNFASLAEYQREMAYMYTNFDHLSRNILLDFLYGRHGDRL